ncbi:4Fe-4S dicluster domain-containing protein [Salisediminibacterium halotolerans]|uniref:4Fe-4S dicluster domain-containing protein n=1 Tax=Salisediminibacterium halotolerans TaxID=517425 RepID=UPI000EB0BD27|nr:4Fe-4S dicluster domain-containing protein [Salisediminibacterium halotolerans]RLJ77992.1 secreted protein [Actinophytocola xinjiangensis]RPE88670.1 secreted protein [Salisediminibacterium halotolerans]TWG36969.1 secreted protein [Salisediminibacterium halotolerans]GEL08418.1 oxidoreductase [Salisediminibacterium halotolerans]
MDRRNFLKRASAATAAAAVVTTQSKWAVASGGESNKQIGSIIDLTKCDGCEHKDTPLCVAACKTKNADRFPQPAGEIMDYWPRDHHEDWSNEQDRTDQLTPYNWTFVDTVSVEHNGESKKVHVPRRCMHCDDATCQKLCPFGVIYKSERGAVEIDEDFCMGGAKCRSSCPWDIPQRQAGVGIYKDLLPQLAGGGVMYKCDMCDDLLAIGERPACETSCPQDAITFGPLESIRQEARQRAEQMNGHVYGDMENGGTHTFYVSEVPYEKIDEAIKKEKAAQPENMPGRPHMEPEFDNLLDTAHGFTLAMAIAPFAGAAAAGITAYKTMKGDKNKEVIIDESEKE